MRVCHRDSFGIGHRQGELGPLQQGAEVAHVGERRDARAGAAFDLFLGDQQRRPELRERSSAQHRGQQQAVGLQGAADLQQGTRQVVDEVQRESGHDQIERLIRRRAALPRPPARAGRRIAPAGRHAGSMSMTISTPGTRRSRRPSRP